MNSGKRLFIIYELEHVPQLQARLRAGEELEVIALEYEVELELQKRGIAYAPLRSVAESCEGRREPIEVTRTAANEWYKHSELAFFAHDGILLGEPHAGPLHHYFGMLVYYLVLLEQIMAHPGIERVVLQETFHTVGERADPTAYFKERVQVDVARMVAERRGIAIEVLPAPPAPAQSAARAWIAERATQFAVGALNALVTALRAPRPLRILSTDPWARIEPFIKDMSDAELVMTRRKEIPNVGRAVWSRRVRFHHPLDFAGRAVRTLARARAEEFARAWDALGESPEVSKLFAYHGSSFWLLAKNVLGAIVKDYGEDAVATIESAKAILERYRINRVLLFGSTKGYNNLWARVAERLDIPSVEMQHALEVTEPSHPYAHLYSRYLAAYGSLTKKHYEQFGVEPRRIIEVGSPRFDQYAEAVPPKQLEAARVQLGLEGKSLTALVTLPARGNSLEPSSFTGYSVSDSVEAFAGVQKRFPELRLLLRPRPGEDSLYGRQEIQGRFAAGTPWVQDEDLRTLLALCDVVISGNSTVVLEAMLMHKPVLLCVRPIDRDFKEFEEAGAVMVARTQEALLAQALALTDAGARRALVARADDFLKRNFILDGTSARRVAALVRTPSALS